MKKKIAIVMALAFLLAPLAVTAVQAEKSNGAAAVLSCVMPGAGEWYNNGWQGQFPWGECIVGYICCLFQWCSIMDAANGNSDTGMRLDFWSAPAK